MSGRCDHVGPAGKSWAQWWHPRLGFVWDSATRATETRCLYCGEPAPMPSNDSPPEVQIEIRAAELADDETIWTPEEIGGGYVAASWKPGEHFSDRLDGAEQWAGYLARCITHDIEDQRRIFPLCIGTTQLAPTNRQCLRCERYGQSCDWKGAAIARARRTEASK